MATMFPRTLNPDDGITKSEVQVFDALEAGLPDEWHVFHSVGWMARDHAEGAQDGEIDFVLGHPDEGIVCLEVKGSGVECIGGSWYRTYKGDRESMKDPFRQALDHRYALERKLAERDGKLPKDLFIVHALAFPTVTVHGLTLPPDAPQEILLDRHDLKDPAESIARVLAYHRGSRDKRKSPGEEGIDALRNLIAPNLVLRTPLAHTFTEEQADLIRLTSQQASILNRYGRERRLVVYGCAGSGKTMIALEQAKRVAARSKRVLFVCFNVALRDFLRERHPVDNLEYWNFHALCMKLAGLGGVELPRYPKGEAPPRFWDEDLPNALVEAIEKLGPQFDALFVDEAQDLENDWLDALMLTLQDPDRDQVWLFMDANQTVYEAQLDVPDEFHPFDLTWNCRNTQAIHNEVIKKYKGEVEPEVIGPKGRPPELIKAKDQASAVSGVVKRLVDEEEVAPQDIAILSAHNLNGSKVGRAGLPGELRYSENPPTLGPYIRFSSIRAFKGLESPVVVLCELEDLDEATRDQQIYVGISRARNHCVVVVPEPD
jgi:hypothetical protein